MITNEYNNNNKEKRIALLTAGIGSRLGTLTEKRNKGLISINNKAIISYLIEKLPLEVPIVVALGYYGDLVKQYLEIAYPERDFIFEYVNPYQGPGSCSGYSLFSLKKHLPGPFIFCTNDTIVGEDIRFEGRNWVGGVASDDIDRYTTLASFGDRITRINRKGEPGGELAYIGLAEINDAPEFWNSLEKALKEKTECSDIEGLYGILSKGIFKKHFTWLDTGTKEKFDEAIKFLGKDRFNLPKEDEDFYMVGDSVIKFFGDKEKCQKRIKRAELLAGLIPKIEAFTDNFYCYKWVEGKTLSEALSQENLLSCLEWAKEKLWKEKTIDSEKFSEMNKEFYYQKTLSRIEKLFEGGWIIDQEYIINGVKHKKPQELIKLLPESFYQKGLAGQFHGDFYSDNILVTPDKKFVLLDWRQDFAGDLEKGDIYYDLAKLYHGLVVSDEYIKKGLYRVDIKGNKVELDFALHYQNLEGIKLLERWILKNNFDLERVRIILALIYLSMSPLHHFPYNQLLFFLGTKVLNKAMKKNNLF